MTPEKRTPPSGGARIVSRVLIGLGIVAVGAFGYLLGVRLSSAGGAQGGFGGGQGGFQRRAGGAQGGAGQSGAGQGAARQGTAAQGAGGRSNSRGNFGGAAASVQTVAARSGSLSASRTTAGTVVPLTQSNVAALSGGTVAQILAPVGSTVRKGQAVAVLNSEALQAAVVSAQNSLEQARVSLATQTNANIDQRAQLSLQVSSARAALATAQQTYATDQTLYGIGGISQSELNSARSAVDSARATLASAQSSLAANERAKTETLAGLALSVRQAENSLAQAQQNAANSTVRAPFDGQVSAVSVSVGETVPAGGAVLTLVSGRRQVTFGVAPTDAGALRAGQVLPFKVSQQTYQIKLDQNPAAPVNSVVTVSARLLGSSPPDIGTVGTVSFTTPVASGTLVPSSAVLADGTQAYVFAVQGGQAKRQNVTVLGQAGEQSAVSGVSAGAQIIASPPSGLLDGASVTVANGAGAASASGTATSGNGASGNSTSGNGTSGNSTSGSGSQGRRYRQGQGTNGASGGYRRGSGTNGAGSTGSNSTGSGNGGSAGNSGGAP